MSAEGLSGVVSAALSPEVTSALELLACAAALVAALLLSWDARSHEDPPEERREHFPERRRFPR